MTDIKTGGPAFPVPEVRGYDGTGIREGSDGLTMRDWFAGQALAGMATWCPMRDNGLSPDFSNKAEVCGLKAEWAYLQADAMLAARAIQSAAPVGVRELDTKIREMAANVRAEYERANMKTCDCSSPDSALHYGRAQGLEMAASALRSDGGSDAE
ncbi:hypothetical protein [Sinorhizobium meliloti]|uniref:hypothetical protein n=1 Tax=Rhizobium meliloti TaxID=382 RepID=UPI001294F682|nr:hypothetical protein [Sinorhizobium meliloti]MQX28966.1 hypothetical protein [Sinorhizobium meliloti]